jgi:NADPH:quinone reductase
VLVKCYSVSRSFLPAPSLWIEPDHSLKEHVHMSVMKAVLAGPTLPGRLALQEVEYPRAAPSEARVRVGAISLNRGEIRRALAAQTNWRPGWDLAGVVESAAADGSGPRQGTRVVGLLAEGAWAEVVAVPSGSLAELPAAVSLTQAATLPVAALTALYTLEKGGSLLGRSVLVTGASGGAGHFAIQLAAYAGAQQVVGVVRQERHVTFAREAGAHQVVVSDDGQAAGRYGPYDRIVDSVGGQLLGNILAMLAPEGTCVNFGVSAATTVTFDLRSFYLAGGTSLRGFYLFQEIQHVSPASGLARLSRLVEAQHLRPHIALEESWERISDVAQLLMERSFAGKAVLIVNPEMK